MWTISTIYDFIVGTLSRLLLAENFDIKGDVSLVTFSGWGLISAILKISTSGFLQTSSFVIACARTQFAWRRVFLCYTEYTCVTHHFWVDEPCWTYFWPQNCISRTFSECACETHARLLSTLNTHVWHIISGQVNLAKPIFDLKIAFHAHLVRERKIRTHTNLVRVRAKRRHAMCVKDGFCSLH